MDEELRRIRADESAADKVYADHHGTTTPDEDYEAENWFTSALARLAPKGDD